MATDAQSKHAPVMVLMGNAATMARPRNVELAGSFMDVYIPKQVSAGEIQTYVCFNGPTAVGASSSSE